MLIYIKKNKKKMFFIGRTDGTFLTFLKIVKKGN